MSRVGLDLDRRAPLTVSVERAVTGAPPANTSGWPVELDPGPPDVAAEVPLGVDGVAALERVEEQPVLGVDDPQPVRPGRAR